VDTQPIGRANVWWGVELVAERPWGAMATIRPSRDVVLGDCYRREYAGLVRLARALLSDTGDAEEVVQEAFVRTYASWRRLQSDEPLAYVRAAVVNLSRDRIRRRMTRRRYEAAPVRAEVVDGPESFDVDATHLRSAVGALPRRQREAVVLRYLEELSTAETAAAMGCSEGSVKAYLHRGIEALRAMEVDR
jgi:RNA polymerase sigma-70 factor (sigma-E family)